MRIPSDKPTFGVSMQQDNQKAVIMVLGTIDRVGLADFETRFFDLLEQTYGDVTIDMCQCEYVCSGVIALITEGIQMVESEGNWVKIKACEGMVKKLLMQSGFAEYISSWSGHAKPLL